MSATETKFITTKTGKTIHIGSASNGQVQTLCGIGYCRRATGRAIPENWFKAEHLCQRCQAMTAGQR